MSKQRTEKLKLVIAPVLLLLMSHLHLKRASVATGTPKNLPPGISDEQYADLVSRFKTIFNEKLAHCNNKALHKNIGNKNDMGEHQKQNIKPEEIISVNETLLRMASTYRNGKIELCGFSRIGGEAETVGYGLNDGYIKILNRRYFYPEEVDQLPLDAKKAEQEIAAYGMERLIGREKMEKLYFNADLTGLVQALTEYMSEQTARDLIYKIDGLSTADGLERDTIIMELRTKMANLNVLVARRRLASGDISQSDYEFEHLRSAMSLRGHIIEKTDVGYKTRDMYSSGETPLSVDGYRLLQNYFKSQEEYNRDFYKYDCIPTDYDVIGQVSAIKHQEEKGETSLAEIEMIKIVDPANDIYSIVKKSDSYSTRRDIREQLREIFGAKSIHSSHDNSTHKL